MLSYGRHGQRGVAIIETVIALPILLAVILGAIQFGLIYEAKATLNYATLQAARSGAVSHAELGAIRQGLARGIVPLYSPDSSLSGYASVLARANQDVSADARIRILNPTREAFDDFGQDVDGERELPNDHLQSRSTTVGARSGLNIQDANLLRVQITYGYELKVPLVNWFIARTLLAFRGSRAMDPFEQQLLRRTFLPIVATSTVRMQSPAHLNDAMVARNDLPNGERFTADTPPPDPADSTEQDDDDSDDENGDSSNDGDQDTGSSLADGFFGFGSGHGAGTADQGSSGNGQGPDSDGDENSGNPQTCDGSAETSEQPVPNQQPAPGLLNDSTSADASVPNRLPSLSVGNPIHVATGNKYQHEIDIAALPGKLGISFSRNYNSELSNRAGSLGAGWRHNFGAHVQVGSANAEAIQITQADGRAIKFLKKDSDRYRAQRAGDGELFVKRAPCSAATCREYTWRWDGGRELLFDATGALTTIREGAFAVHLEYDAHHRLERVTDPESRVLALHYDRKGRISRVHVTGGATRNFKYDRRNNLVEVIATDHRARRYHYEDSRHPHHLTGISAGMERLATYGQKPSFERLATWGYDDEGRAILSTHALNADRVMLKFGKGFTDVTDSFGRVSHYVTQVRDGVAVVTKVQGPGCNVCGIGDVSYSYSDANAIAEQRIKGQPLFRYEYDPEHRLVATYRDGLLLKRYEYEGESTEPAAVELPSVNPDGHHRIEIRTRANGKQKEIREIGYEPTEYGFNRIERTYRLVYDAIGQLVQIDGPREDVEDITKFQYDELHRLAVIVDPDGNEQRVLARDDAGRPTRVQRSGQPSILLSYDVEGRLTSLSSDLHDGPKLSTQYRYDERGRLHEIEYPDHRTRQITFDAADRVTEERTLEGLTKITRYATDGQVTQESLLDSGLPLKTLYFAFDRDRRLMEVRDGDGPALQRLEYSGAGLTPSSIMDALGRQTQLEYDSLGSIERVTNASGADTGFDHDALERVNAVNAPGGSSTRFKYDDFGRKVEELSPDRGVVRYRYDGAGHLRQLIDARGKTRAFEYSKGGALEVARDDDGEVRLTYHSGHLVAVDAPSASQSSEYDADGRLSSTKIRIANNQYATEFRYDEFGRVAKKRLFSGSWLTYGYDEHGSLARIRLENLLRKQNVVERADRRQTRPLSPLSDLRFGNALVARNVIDADARLARRTIATVSKLDYGYDDANRIASLAVDGHARRFGYDQADRLTSDTSASEFSRYEYDANGNRTHESHSSEAERYDYDSQSNRLIGVNRATVAYDAAGNIKAIGERSYEYNSTGRPTRMWVRGKLIAQYSYNASGERIRKVDYSHSKPIVTDYLYEQHKLVAEADAGGRVYREYVYLDQHPVAMIDRGELLWVHTDHLGSPIAVTDNNRRVVWRAEYEPFGRAAIDEDPDHDGKYLELNLRRPGQYADRESGTYYNYYRDYDPALGRYLTSDPLGMAAGTNTYAYARSDPMNRFDPLGLYDAYVHFYMTYFLALVAGLPPEIAQTIATATEYIDENPLTSPLGPNFLSALPRYHFTLDYDETHFHGDANGDPLNRFYDPRSEQLSNLYRITTEAELNKLWDEVHPLQAGMCPFRRIEDARYQLFGEFLHAYEDTFAHRDSKNVPYDFLSFNDDNDPQGWFGHVGPEIPSGSNAPDHSYNQSYPSESQCRVLIDGSYATFPMGEAECERRNGIYIPADWQYNELRTLRMEYETLEFLKKDFSTAIANNLANGGQQFSWQDLAGTSTWDRSSVRIGSDELPIQAVLQRFNSARDEEKLAILNTWLVDHELPRVPPLTAGSLQSAQQADIARYNNLSWIPRGAESTFRVLLPIQRVP